MIYLITGVPGSGKTLYAVSTLLKKLAAENLKDKKGVPIQRRLIVDGIPDLALPHELMADRPEEVVINGGTRGPVFVPRDMDSEHGLWNWFQWCKPGDIIVADEVQRHWRPRGMGVKPPMEIAALETHRHMGVDFVIITQNPMLLDQNVRRLVGRHQHVRRILGLARAVIYEWDGCSADVHRTATATTSMWRFPKDAYKLYKSSELHTKQRFKLPAWLIVPVLAVAGGAFIAPTVWATLSGVSSGRGLVHDSGFTKPIPVTAVSGIRPGASVGPASALVPSLASASAPVVGSVPVLAGCVIFRGVSECRDQFGAPIDASAEDKARLLAFGPSDKVVPVASSVDGGDLEVVAWVHRQRIDAPRQSFGGPHWIK